MTTIHNLEEGGYDELVKCLEGIVKEGKKSRKLLLDGIEDLTKKKDLYKIKFRSDLRDILNGLKDKTKTFACVSSNAIQVYGGKCI